jgi:DNA-binding transcriptional MerR regulator
LPIRERRENTTLYDLSDLAEATGVKATTLASWVRAGRLPAQDVGVATGRRYSAEAFERAVAAVRERLRR